MTGKEVKNMNDCLFYQRLSHAFLSSPARADQRRSATATAAVSDSATAAQGSERRETTDSRAQLQRRMPQQRTLETTLIS
jgi:hypothetical protein